VPLLLFEEEAAAQQSIAPALAHAKENRLLRVSYESLASALAWQSIANHTRVSMPSESPTFRDGNLHWRVIDGLQKQHAAQDFMMRTSRSVR